MSITDHSLRRFEIARLLALAVCRQQQTHCKSQNLAPSAQDCLDEDEKEVLSVSKTVNTNGEQGEA